MEKTDQEIKQDIEQLFSKAECVTYKDKNFISMACKELNISTLRFLQIVADMAKEGYKNA